MIKQFFQENSKLASNYDEDYEISYEKGDMYNFKEGNAPWCKWRNDIKTVSVERYVTYLGTYAFYNCPNLTEINFNSDWVTEIGQRAFYSCNSLSDIYYDGSEEEWNNIDIHSSNNSVLNSCKIHYNGAYSDDDNKYYYNDDYIYRLSLTSEKSGHEAKITITSEPEGATIYYTLDGEEPTEDSEIYTEPIYLYEDTLIRVWATYKGSESNIMDFQLTFDANDVDDDDDSFYLDTSGIAKFEDDNEISDYAKPSVYYMAKFGIIKGVDETHFAPKNSTEWQKAVGYATATRELALIMALRIFNVSAMWQ